MERHIEINYEIANNLNSIKSIIEEDIDNQEK